VTSWPFAGAEPTSRWELLQPLRRLGIPLYLTSDAFGPGLGNFTTSLTQARVNWGISAEELIALVSGEPARALGIDKDKGSLSAGAIADFVVLKGDLRTNPAALLEPESVYRHGVEVVQNGWMSPSAVAMAAQLEGDAQQDLLNAVFKELN
jgi:imidazolonepropionase-like amidohydrolase